MQGVLQSPAETGLRPCTALPGIKTMALGNAAAARAWGKRRSSICCPALLGWSRFLGSQLLMKSSPLMTINS